MRIILIISFLFLVGCSAKFDGYDPEPAVYLMKCKLWLLCNIERIRQSETGQ